MEQDLNMLKLYSWPTPNSYKVTILLRELKLPYEFHIVNISTGEQFDSEFIKLTPNNKIPVLVDSNPKNNNEALVLFESGCILEYLADKSGQFLEPFGDAARYETLKWLYWQMAGFGPMLGQNHHFSQYAATKIPYAIDRYVNEAKRLYKVLDFQLAQTKGYVAGSKITIADFAIYPWTLSFDKQGIKMTDYPNVKKWMESIAARPAVVEAYLEGEKIKEGRATVTEEARKILFGQSGEHLK